MSRFIAAGILFTSGLFAQTPPTRESAQPVSPTNYDNPAFRGYLGYWNGRFWRTLQQEQKIVYLLGISDATQNIVSIASITDRSADYRTALLKYWPTPLTLNEISTSLDNFYQTPENGPIQIVDAIMVIAKRSTGTPETEIQKQILILRKIESVQ